MTTVDRRYFILSSVALPAALKADFTAEMKRLVADPVHIDSVLASGAERAQIIAAETMKAVKDIVGLVHR